MKGGNLIHAKQEFLFNTLDATKFGGYLDSITALKHLVVKEFGLDIQGAAAAAGVLPAGYYCRKDTTSAGLVQAIALALTPTYPDIDINYEAWVAIANKAKHDGSTDQYIEVERTYNHVIPQLDAAVSGHLDPADGGDVDEINERLIIAINNDPNAIVTAGLAFTFDIVDNATTSTFDVPFVGGTITFTGAGGTGAIKKTALLLNINTTQAGYAVAYSSGTLQITVIETGTEKFVTPNNAVQGTLSAVTVHLLGLVAKSADTQFRVGYENEDWATVTTLDAGAYPVMDYTWMVRNFAIKPDQAGTFVDVPLNASYTKYHIRYPIEPHPGLTGASSVETRYREVDFYVLTSLISTNLWDDTNYMWEPTHAGFTADKTFEQLLLYAFELTPGSWPTTW
ncbi:hypothetical protein A2Z67_02675 [Candidatus Woesebacteria bacterium RBG_13_36_22]|uniref:Uncharacterized protein n=1 Tax=Candidatus Woesebacteria bacterium RBG_13_36_22 TaxID=1802478 RepID=A0A1F7X1D9_9BACT|nr:MAG: hypothetical protein A2Z67_02675 [Candidatus Woesebacteria bacterium RBG_13_36_22]